MCGIVGFIGQEQAAPILLEGLRRLEDRGDDSAGLAVLDPEQGLQVAKAKGRLQVLSDMVDGGAMYYNMCIDGTGIASVADSFAALQQRIEEAGDAADFAVEQDEALTEQLLSLIHI